MNIIIKCKVIGRKKKWFIKTLHDKLIKDIINDETKLDNMHMLNDILQYLKNQTNYKTIQ